MISFDAGTDLIGTVGLRRPLEFLSVEHVEIVVGTDLSSTLGLRLQGAGILGGFELASELT